MRPRKTELTDHELEIMKVVWARGSATVRDVYGELLKHRKIAYTTVMTVMGVLEQKGRLNKSTDGRAYLYTPSQPQSEVVTSMVRDFVGRVREKALGQDVLTSLTPGQGVVGVGRGGGHGEHRRTLRR